MLQVWSVEYHCVENFVKLVLKVLVNVALHWTDCVYFGIAVYEETVINNSYVK
jgi:hypothetical protein